MFGWFGKKKKDEEENKYLYDPTNVKLYQLRKGAFLDYNLQTWQVTEAYEYDWGNGFIAQEFLLLGSDDSFYLYVANDGEVIDCSIARKINILDIEGDVAGEIIETDKAPRSLVYEGENYFRKGGEEMGYFRNVAEGDSWHEFISWTYAPKTGDKFIIISQWGEEDFDAVIGHDTAEHQFSGIIMP